MGKGVRCWGIFGLCVFLASAGCGRLTGNVRDADEGDGRTADSLWTETEPNKAPGGFLPEEGFFEAGNAEADFSEADAEGANQPETAGEAETASGAGESPVLEGTGQKQESSGGTEREQHAEAAIEQKMPTENLDELEQMLLEGRFYYNYSLLTQQEDKRLYLEILCSLLRLDEGTRLSAVDTAQVERMFDRVMADHPEIFYVDGYECTTYTLAGELIRIAFRGSYTMDPAQIENRRMMLESAADDWLSGAGTAVDDYGRVKYLYESLIVRTEYELESPDSQNICSVLLGGKSVCQGYAKTLQYLCQRLGIPALLVTGRIKGQGHAWDLLMLDGEWYYVDPTWGDASYRRTEGSALSAGVFPAVNYDYFCVTTEQLERTHELAAGQTLPVCSAVADQYYRREGLYLESADEAVLAALFSQAAVQGKQTVMFQCASDQVYEEVYQLLITGQKVFAFLPVRSQTVAYVHFKEQRTFCFWLESGEKNS